MKKILLAFVSIFVALNFAFASGDNFTAGARATAMGDASVTLADVFSTTTNQAGLGFVENYSIVNDVHLRIATKIFQVNLTNLGKSVKLE